MSNENKANQGGWLKQRVEATRLLVENMLMVRRAMEDKGPKNAKRPPRARPNALPPPAEVKQGQADLTEKAKMLILLGDDQGLKRLVRECIRMGSINVSLLELAVERGQAECLYVLLSRMAVVDGESAVLYMCDNLLHQAAWLDRPVPRVIHMLAAWIRIGDGDEDSSPVRLEDLLRAENNLYQIIRYTPRCEANAKAVTAWLLEDSDPLITDLPFRLSAPYPWVKLFTPFRLGMLHQHKVEFNRQNTPVDLVLQSRCNVSNDAFRFDILPTEQEAMLVQLPETYWELEEKKLRSGRPRQRGEFVLKSTSMDLKYFVPPGQLVNIRPFSASMLNQDRDAAFFYTGRDLFVLSLEGCSGSTLSEIDKQYVLDGSKSKLETTDMEKNIYDIADSPVAIIVVSIDSGSVVGYLSYTDDEESKGDVRGLKPNRSGDPNLRVRGFGLPSYSDEPGDDDEETNIQSFMTDVREKAIICVANCSALYVHYTSGETMWNSVVNIVPHEKRRH